MGKYLFATILIAALVATTTMPVMATTTQRSQGTPVVNEPLGPRFAIRPADSAEGYFVQEIDAGEQRELTVELENYGGQPGLARTYVADAQTLINGGLGANLEADNTSEVLEWISYPAETFELKPGEIRTRQFTVAIPNDATPGEYIAMLAIETAERVDAATPADDGSPGGIVVIPVIRQVIAIAITIPGPREPGLEIGEVLYEPQTSGANVLVTVTNTGNVHLSPDAIMVVRGEDGSEVTKATIEMETFYRGTSTFVQLALLQPLQPGEYTVSLTLTEDEIPDTEPIKVTKEDMPLTIVSPEVSGTPGPAGIAINSVAISETRGTDDALQAAEIVTTIENAGAPVSNAQLTLTVERDGELVEEFVLGSSLSFPQGSAEFRQRYAPLDGWKSGTYTFTVTLEATDPNTGELVELSTAEAEMTVTVP